MWKMWCAASIFLFNFIAGLLCISLTLPHTIKWSINVCGYNMTKTVQGTLWCVCMIRFSLFSYQIKQHTQILRWITLTITYETKLQRFNFLYFIPHFRLNWVCLIWTSTHLDHRQVKLKWDTSNSITWGITGLSGCPLLFYALMTAALGWPFRRRSFQRWRRLPRPALSFSWLDEVGRKGWGFDRQRMLNPLNLSKPSSPTFTCP